MKQLSYPGEKEKKGDPGPRGFSGASEDTLKIDPNGYLTKSSSGLGLSPNYIETAEVKTDLVNVKHDTADTATAVRLPIEQGTKQEMRRGNQQITGVINQRQDHEVVSKLYVDDQKVLMKSYVDEKHRRAMTSYSANSIRATDKIQGVLVTNTVRDYSNIDLAFLNDGMVRFLINISRTFVGSKVTFNITTLNMEHSQIL